MLSDGGGDEVNTEVLETPVTDLIAEQSAENEQSAVVIETEALQTSHREDRTTEEVRGEDEGGEDVPLLGNGVTSPVNSRQDYRLNFTEIEGLEAVPEEMPAKSKIASSSEDVLASSFPLSDAPKPVETTTEDNKIIFETPIHVVTNTTSQCEPQAPSSSAITPAIPQSSASEVTNPGINDLNSVASAHFHIPESNASDVGAYSESSFYQDRPNSHIYGLIKNSEPLSAKQQVALWLTRSSMSDVSSMPSLRSLIFPNSAQGQTQSASKAQGPSKSISAHKMRLSMRSFRRRGENLEEKVPQGSSGQDKSRSRRGKAEIHRNFSTKSLINGYGVQEPPDLMTPSPIRKCATVIAISGMESSSASQSGMMPSGSPRTGRSSLNLFKRLSRRSMPPKAASTTGMRTPRAGCGGPTYSTHSDVFTDGGCDSPFRVGMHFLYVHFW